MEGARTRGQAAALAAVAAMVRGPAPQAVLFVGPDGVGKTTLALDLAAGLLCTAAPEVRPARTPEPSTTRSKNWFATTTAMMPTDAATVSRIGKRRRLRHAAIPKTPNAAAA